jgi:SAM-dependent methyltransferase
VSACCACGAEALRLHLEVAGEAGERGLVPDTDRYGTALAHVARCDACGHAQLDPMPPHAVLDAAYAEAASDAYLEERAGQLATAGRVLDVVERHVRPGRVLDVGCWVGWLLVAARERGWDGVGVEPSDWAARVARAEHGLRVHHTTLDELPEGPFDAIVLGDVIEHLPDPARALSVLRGRLRPGGVLVLMIPDAGSRVARVLGRRWWSVIPTHVQYFTRRSIATLLHREGLEPMHVSTDPKAFTVAYYAGRLHGYSPAAARAVGGVVERLGLAGRLWAPDFRDRMLVVARRPEGAS